MAVTESIQSLASLAHNYLCPEFTLGLVPIILDMLSFALLGCPGHRIINQTPIGIQGNSIRRSSLVDDVQWLVWGMPHNQQLLHAKKIANLPAQSLLHMAEAEAEAKIPNADASRPPLQDIIGLGMSLPQDPLGLCTLDNTPPSMPMAPPPPKSCTPRNPAPSALAAPHARDADMSPLPSAPPLELLME
jgi:hypothetical protein